MKIMAFMKDRVYYGANIFGPEGGSVVVDDLGNNAHATIMQVNRAGAVEQTAEKRFIRLHLEDRHQFGVQVFRGVNDNPILTPGIKQTFNLGQNRLNIEGTSFSGFRYNGQPIKGYDKELERVRYPRLP